MCARTKAKEQLNQEVKQREQTNKQKKKKGKKKKKKRLASTSKPWEIEVCPKKELAVARELLDGPNYAVCLRRVLTAAG